MILQAVVLAMAIPPVLHSQPYRWIIRKLKLDRPPMTCATCLGFWIGLAAGIAMGMNPICIFLGAGMTALLSNEADKIHTRLF